MMSSFTRELSRGMKGRGSHRSKSLGVFMEGSFQFGKNWIQFVRTRLDSLGTEITDAIFEAAGNAHGS